METEVKNVEPKFAHPIFKVTALSKYFALTLFIIMPFIGGYIGYVYAPEKVIEVERVVEVDKIKIDVPGSSTRSQTDYNWSMSNDFSKISSVVRSQDISMDISPYSKKILNFVVESQIPADDDRPLIDYLNFDKETGLISLKDYWGFGSVDELLHVYRLPESDTDLETLLEDIALKEGNRTDSDWSEDLPLILGDAATSGVTFRSFCQLQKNSLEGWVGLRHDEVKYGTSEDLDFMFNPCGSDYQIADNLLIRNYAEGIDATEPQVQSFSLDENTFYLKQDTGEKVYKYKFGK